jgi:hypothetical protein
MATLGDRANRLFGVARASEELTFEPVEIALGCIEPESGLIAGDNAGGTSAALDDVGV